MILSISVYEGKPDPGGRAGPDHTELSPGRAK